MTTEIKLLVTEIDHNDFGFPVAAVSADSLPWDYYRNTDYTAVIDGNRMVLSLRDLIISEYVFGCELSDFRWKANTDHVKVWNIVRNVCVMRMHRIAKYVNNKTW